MKSYFLTLSFLKMPFSAWFFGILSSILISYILPIEKFIVFAFASIIADLITGILASRKKGEKIKSRGLYRTIEKMLVEASLIIVVHMFDVTFNIPVDLVYVAAGIVAVSELKSIVENTETILGVSIWAALSKFITIAKK